MGMLGTACLSIAAAALLAAVAFRLRKVLGSVSLRTDRRRLRGFSVFDMQVIVGNGVERPKREAALYLTLKTSPAEPLSAAKLLFEQKVRRLGE
jgi:hypothetical protein